jgi:hypothetical protein
MNDTAYFDLENENGFFSVYFFLLSTYIYAVKTDQMLCIKDDKWKFTYLNGLDDYFILNKRILKYSSSPPVPDAYLFCHMKEPPMRVRPTLNDYRIYSKELYTVRPDILQSYDLPAKYNSIFIRGGDKLIHEAKPHVIAEYVKCLVKLDTDIEDLFVHSDDNRLVEQVKQYIEEHQIPLRVHKITDERCNGGAVIMKRLRHGICKDIQSIDEMDAHEKYTHTVLMLNAIEIMRKSENIIVSYDTNVSRFMKLNFDCNVYDIEHTKDLQYEYPTRNPAYGFQEPIEAPINIANEIIEMRHEIRELKQDIKVLLEYIKSDK